MSRMRLFTGLLTAGVLVTGMARPIVAQQDTAAARDSQPGVAEQLEQLDQKVRVLSRLLELRQDSAAAAAKQQPRVVAGKEGFVLKSADGAFQLKVRGYVQADGRFFPSEAPATLGTSTFFLRRARVITEVTLWKFFALRFAPDFGQGRVVLFDAYVDFRPVPRSGYEPERRGRPPASNASSQ